MREYRLQRFHARLLLRFPLLRRLNVRVLRLRLWLKLRRHRLRHHLAEMLRKWADRIDSEPHIVQVDSSRNRWYGERATWR